MRRMRKREVATQPKGFIFWPLSKRKTNYLVVRLKKCKVSDLAYLPLMSRHIRSLSWTLNMQF